MHHAHKAGSHTAEVGSDHHLFAVFFAHHVLRKENLLAEINGLFSQRINNHVTVRAGDALKAVHVGVDAGVEVLVAGHAGCEVGVHQHLVEHGKVAVHAQLDVFFLIADDPGARGFRPGSRQGGYGDLVGRGIFYKVPALIVFSLAGVGEQIAHALAGIKHTAAAKGHQGARFRAVQKCFHLGGIAVHAVSGRLSGGVDIEHHVAAFHRQLSRQVLALEKVIQKEDSRAGHGLAARSHKIAEMAQAALANHIITDIFCITVHSCPHSMA